jgi:hypothetical protein
VTLPFLSEYPINSLGFLRTARFSRSGKVSSGWYYADFWGMWASFFGFEISM